MRDSRRPARLGGRQIRLSAHYAVMAHEAGHLLGIRGGKLGVTEKII